MDAKVNHVQGVEIWKGMFVVDKGQRFAFIFLSQTISDSYVVN